MKHSSYSIYYHKQTAIKYSQDKFYKNAVNGELLIISLEIGRDVYLTKPKLSGDVTKTLLIVRPLPVKVYRTVTTSLENLS